MISKGYLRQKYTRGGFSAFDIAKKLKCSQHKVNYWISKHNILKRSISEAMYLKNNPGGDPFKIREAKTIGEAKLFGLGLGLYWGEGNRRSKTSIRLGNTDPNLIKTFIEFLLVIFGISSKKLKFGLQIFSDMSANRVLFFWLNKLRPFNIKKNQFSKVTVTPARSIGTYREKSKYGVLTVHFNNTKLKKILDSMLPL